MPAGRLSAEHRKSRLRFCLFHSDCGLRAMAAGPQAGKEQREVMVIIGFVDYYLLTRRALWVYHSRIK
jgi:hypothetical protein